MVIAPLSSVSNDKATSLTPNLLFIATNLTKIVPVVIAMGVDLPNSFLEMKL